MKDYPTRTSAAHKTDSNGIQDNQVLISQTDPPCLAAALYYLSLGWSPVPLCHPSHQGKIPAWHAKRCQERNRGKCPLVHWRDLAHYPPTPLQVRDWWKEFPLANVGIVLGGPTLMTAWDVDGPEGMAQLLELLQGELPETLEFTTPGGGRRYIYSPRGIRGCPVRHFRNEGRALSFLSLGSLTVMPPSIHHSGRFYEWPENGGPDKVKIAELTDRMYSVLNSESDRKRQTGGWSVGVGVGGGNHSDWQTRAKAYCDACPPAIEGKGGDVQTWKLACALVRTFGLTPHQTFRVLWECYNPRCEPPWSERELWNKAQRAYAAEIGNYRPEASGPTRSPAIVTPGVRIRTADGPEPATSADQVAVGPALAEASDRTSSPAIPRNPPNILASNRPGCEAPTNGCVRAKQNSDSSSEPTHTPTQEPTPNQHTQTTHTHTNNTHTTPHTNNTNGLCVQPQTEQTPPTPTLAGRLASDLIPQDASWFLQPWFPRGMLTLIVGAPTSGKSTLVAYLLSLAKRAILLPGSEEHLNIMTLPRLKAHGVKLDQVRILDTGDWCLPQKRDRLMEQVELWKADLLVLDPIGSYLVDGLSENTGKDVRAFLESLNWIAERTGCAVVGVRHPGKDPNNVMVGSAQWNAVPRSTVELVVDPGPPRQNIIRHHKDSLGQNAPPQRYELVGDQGKPKVFTLADQVDPRAVALAKEVPDRTDRTMTEQAIELLKGLLANGEMEAKEVKRRGDAEGFNIRMMQRAAGQLGVIFTTRTTPTGSAGFWSLPPNLV